MRVLLVVNLLLLLIGIGYAFRITEFLEQFVDSGHRNSERQSTDVSDQIVPVFAIAFFASLVNSLLFMNSATTTTAEGKMDDHTYWIRRIVHACAAFHWKPNSLKF